MKILEDHGYEEGHRSQGGNRLPSVSTVIPSPAFQQLTRRRPGFGGHVDSYSAHRLSYHLYVFQISVAGISTLRFVENHWHHARQLRRIIRIQALILSLMGIPIGLVLGWLLGGVHTRWWRPAPTESLKMVSVSPVLFAASWSAFALVTVFISCRRPGKVAGKVSPVEVVALY